ncbi:MAG TPA: coenzyme A pyrophosphatase [Flavobacteriaceae bacterium]|jgi:8-oxo-dGTP pyrophosphatase MutT (NUDIX family)|nr:coenzyme A pyrophosphatase [Flavobacteriaceae bacterium]
MEFNYFLSHLSKLKELPLGGIDSQFKMAPELRKKFSLEDITAKKPKESAVLALFYPDKDHNTKIVLMLRSNYKGVHASQISFPGGKKEKTDYSLKHTALRETEEEIGVLQPDITIIRELTKTYIPPSNFWVTPFLGFVQETPTFTTNYEVEKIIEISLSNLIDDKNLSCKNLTTSYMENIDVPCFKLNDYTVWGATAMMLSEIKDLIKLV